MPVGVGHREVAGQDVVQRRDVGRALDGGVPAQGHDPAAGPADVAEQQLDDRRGADVLHADRVLGPADRVARTRRCARGRSSRTAPRRPRGTARCGTPHDLLDHLRRVAADSAAQQLEDAARVLQRRGRPRAARRARAGCRARRGPAHRLAAASRSPARPTSARIALVLPGVDVVGAASRVPAGEQPVEVLGVRGTSSSMIVAAFV